MKRKLASRLPLLESKLLIPISQRIAKKARAESALSQLCSEQLLANHGLANPVLVATLSHLAQLVFQVVLRVDRDVVLEHIDWVLRLFETLQEAEGPSLSKVQQALGSWVRARNKLNRICVAEVP